MRKNQITVKQICALFACLLPLTKIVCAPSVISSLYEEKLWQPVAVWFILELLFIVYVFILDKMHGGKTYYAVLSDGYGEFFARAVYFVYAIYFALKSYLFIIEHKLLIETAFYEILPSSPVFYPLFIVAFYTSLKGLKTIGRAAEFCLPICWAGLITIFFLSVPSGDWDALFPLFYGSKNGAIDLLSTISWFGDSLYLLFFMGHFKREKRVFLKTAISYAVPAVFTAAFFCCFYAVFTYVAPSQIIAIKETGIFSVTLQNVGRFDYLAIFLISLAGVLAVSFPIVTSVKLFERAFALEKATIPAIALNAALLVATYFFAQKYNEILAIYRNYFSAFFAVCGFVIPLTALRRTNENKKLQAG